MSRWATVQALVEQTTFAIDQTQFAANAPKIPPARQRITATSRR